MVGDAEEVFARIEAYREGRAVPIRATSRLSAEPAEVFAIAPIQMVAEQRLQAIAFGSPEGEPRVVVIPNPLDREAERLGPFAAALEDYLLGALSDGYLPRIWVAHKAALKLITLIGERYRTNSAACAQIQRLGWLCYGLGVEAQFDGQQTIAVASELLRAHVVTGQSPTEDLHLGALLAWIDPPAGADARVAAAERALKPAEAMLDRDSDDRVEELRVKAKGSGAEARAVREEIERLLRSGAEAEWRLLVEARRAFWNLGLPPAQTLDLLVSASRERMRSLIANNFNPPSQPHSLARRLDGLEHAIDLVVNADIRGDARVRERARRAGRVIGIEVIGVDQPRPRQLPCVLLLRTEQEVLRVRRGTKLQTLDAKVEGVVVAVRTEAGTGDRMIELSLSKGVLSGEYLRPGARYDLADTSIFGGESVRNRIYRALRDARPALVYGREMPAAAGRRLEARDLLEVAERLRRRGQG